MATLRPQHTENSSLENVTSQQDIPDQTQRQHQPDDDPERKTRQSSTMERLAKDKYSIALLLLLYILQGVPIGLGASLPIILQTKKIGYRQQAMFSLVTWPFSIKLLWAPLVDAIFSRRFGRRKSWLVPAQYFIGFMMILLSFTVGGLLGNNETPPNVPLLTFIFFFLHFLAATQDIAVDGWALTILSKENVGFASTCNTVGQTTGFFVSYTFFLALQSKDFCNSYLRWEPQETGILELPTFLYYAGVIFVIVTTCVWVFKREKPAAHAEDKSDILEAYMKLLGVLKLPSIQTYALGILTAKVAFAAADSATGLKLIEAGVPADNIALMAVAAVPLQIILPFAISQITAGPRPMSIFFKAYSPRVFMGLVFAAVVWWTSRMSADREGGLPLYYYFVIVVLFLIHQVFTYTMFVSSIAFHAKISDPTIGGTYMTLLNTITNLAGTWTATLALWLLDNVSFKDCEGVSDFSLDCDTMEELKACEAAGGHCVTHLDGYYVEVAFCTLFGIVWLWWQRSKITRLETLDDSHWKAKL